MAVCRHCQRKRANRPRGLCWACYYAPGVREQYPSTSKFAPKENSYQSERLASLGTPERPTPYPPGTVGKKLDLGRRAQAGLDLWHPGDWCADLS